jgi:hypothetical protein
VTVRRASSPSCTRAIGVVPLSTVQLPTCVPFRDSVHAPEVPIVAHAFTVFHPAGSVVLEENVVPGTSARIRRPRLGFTNTRPTETLPAVRSLNRATASGPIELSHTAVLRQILE